MLNREITNTPLLRFIFAYALTFKEGFQWILEAQLHSSKGGFFQPKGIQETIYYDGIITIAQDITK